MTESHHPSDEQLSAAIDGLDAAAASHAASCSRCSYRLEAMRGVAAAIGTPPPVDQLLRERIISAALQRDVEAPMVLTERRSVPLAWIAGIAAVALAAVLVVPVLFDSDSQSARTTDAASDGDPSYEFGAGGTGESTGYLGEFDDPQELGAVVGPLIGEDGVRNVAPVAGGADESDSQASPTTTASALGGQATSGAPCASTVAAEYGQGLGPLVYSSSLTWQDTAAYLLAYDVEGATGELDHRVFVMSQAGCSLLTVFSL